MHTQRSGNQGLSGKKHDVASHPIARVAGAATVIAMLALGATGATTALATAAIVGLVGFAVSRLAVKRFRGEGEHALDSDFRGFTGQLP